MLYLFNSFIYLKVSQKINITKEKGQIQSDNDGLINVLNLFSYLFSTLKH